MDKKYLFENIKNGDYLGFYHKPWYFLFSKVIFWTTRKKIDHVAQVFDVKRYDSILNFSVGEQMTSGRRITKYSIVNTLNNTLIDSRFRDDNLRYFYLPIKTEINLKQNKLLREYWSKKVDYEFSQLPFVFNWVYKLFGDKKKTYDRVCSTACNEAANIIGIAQNNKDKVTSPAEFLKLNFIKEIIRL
jgi:hypothetical protein